jgi:hypothetical protein
MDVYSWEKHLTEWGIVSKPCLIAGGYTSKFVLKGPLMMVKSRDGFTNAKKGIV